MRSGVSWGVLGILGCPGVSWGNQTDPKFFYHLLTFDETMAHKTCRASKIKKLRGN